MNKWLYHAAGTAGIVGGFLLLGTGSAQADDRNEDFDALIDEVFSPTSGLPPLGLPLDAPTSALPLGGTPLEAPTSALPLGGTPLDTAGLSDLALGAGLPIPGELLQLEGNPIGLPTRFANTGLRNLPMPVPMPVDTGYRTLPAPAPLTGPAGGPADYGYRTLPAPAPLTGPAGGPADYGYRTLPAPAPLAPEDAGREEIVGPMPYLTEPLTRALLGGRSLGDLVALGDPTSQVPVAGPMVSQTARNLPLVSDLAPDPRNQTMPAGPQARSLDSINPLGQAGPIVGEQLPPVIAQQLAAQGGYSPELLDAAEPELLGGGGLPLLGGGGLPLMGSSLDPVTHMVGVGDLPSQVPVVGPLAGPVLDGLPLVGSQAPAAPAIPGAVPGGPALDPATGAGERPVTGEEPEFTESLI